jgi:hypothetical protein
MYLKRRMLGTTKQLSSDRENLVLIDSGLTKVGYSDPMIISEKVAEVRYLQEYIKQNCVKAY